MLFRICETPKPPPLEETRGVKTTAKVLPDRKNARRRVKLTVRRYQRRNAVAGRWPSAKKKKAQRAS